MRGKALLGGCAAAAALALTGSAGAVAVERIPLGGGARPETSGFPPGVFLTLVSPSAYVAQSPGRWVGPAYWPSADPSQRGESAIDWSVTFRDRSVEPDSAAAAATQRGWREQERGGIAVPHVAGKTMLGTIQSYFVLKQNDAMHEAALAIPISPASIAIVKFIVSAPATSTQPGLGDNLVLGSFFATTWNRGQAFLALSGVQLEGNLTPSAVTINRVPGRRAVAGTVLDAFKNAVVRARIVLERRVGAAWRRIRVANTGSEGTYIVPTGQPGRFRVSVTYAGTTLRSGSVPVP